MTTDTNSVYNPSSPDLAKLTISDMKKIFGRSGTEVYSGYFETDEVADWNDTLTRARIVNKMRREYVACSSAINILNVPILATNWDIVGGDEEQREFAKQQLFGLTQRTWQELLQEILTYLPFGYAVFEKIFNVTEDGKIGLFDLAPRIQESIEKFRMSNGGAGVQQRLYGDIVPQQGNATIVDIPLQKLLIFTNNKEGDDLIGMSVLRPARMHTVMIDRMYRVQGISAERFGVGIPIVKYPDAGGDAEKQQAEEMGKYIKANQQTFVAMKSDWDISILTPSGNPLSGMIENSIAHHNRQILLTCMAHALDTGSKGAGSLALSRTQQFDRLSFAEQKATYIANQLNKYVIKQLIDINFGKQEVYPELTFEPLGAEDSNQLSSTYKTLFDMGVLNTQDPELVNYVRKVFNLPTLTEEQILDMEEARLQEQEAELDAEMADSEDMDFDPLDSLEEDDLDLAEDEMEDDEEDIDDNDELEPNQN